MPQHDDQHLAYEPPMGAVLGTLLELTASKDAGDGDGMSAGTVDPSSF